ncbi:TMEM175 family protein [Deinococcus radiomollis]|uniref:TMEM175 family protein n=1 Tax=Deinococcus radiomollis TaxID=468916 RepID=UPI003891FC06
MTRPPNPTAFFRSPGRLEAFSDGVFAIAITLLILEIKVPSAHDASTVAELWRALLERWPSYFAFLLSFLTIYVAWSGHHLMVQQVKTVTLSLVWTNAFFLLVITFLPFPTALVAEHLTSPSGSLAVAVYAATNACSSLMYLCLYTVSNQDRTAPNRLRYARLNALGGVAICVACVGLAFVSKTLALLLVGAVWVWWSLPRREEPPLAASD